MVFSGLAVGAAHPGAALALLQHPGAAVAQAVLSSGQTPWEQVGAGTRGGW